MILKLNKHFNGFLIKYQAIKGFLNAIKVKFCRSKILIPVMDGSTVLTRVTTLLILSAAHVLDKLLCSNEDFFVSLSYV